ncbi:MAG: LCP family protein [Armatimonadota bacterium]|jgi:LCP family protein required for cell wall assembly
MRAFVDYLIYVFAFCVVGVGALGAWDAVSEQPRVIISADAGERAAETLPEPNLGRQTILLVGCDARPELGDHGRSDTVILLFVNPRTKKAALLSIPRDLRVSIPGYGSNKINAAFAFGGVDLLRRTVEQEIGVDIDAWATANFEGFVEIVDQLGGVEIDVPDVEGRGRGMNYTDRAGNLYINLRPGVQMLDGRQAIGFVRYRKGDSDFKRSERQQQFLKAMAEQKLKLRNALDLAKVVPTALEAIETDIGWRKAVDLARVVREVRPDCLLMTNFQPYLRDTKIGGIYYVTISESSIKRVLDEINHHLNTMPGQINVVDVLNGSGESGVAAAAGGLLIDEGFEINDTGNADSFDYEQTLVYYPDDGLAAARRVQRVLGTGDLVELDSDAAYAADRITIVLGADIDPEELEGREG